MTEHLFSIFEIDEITVRVEIQSKNGGRAQLEIGGLPPEGPQRSAIIHLRVHEFLAEQDLRYQRKALNARIVELQAKVKRETTRTAELKTPSSPPFLAELLISNLAPKSTAQAQLGDLQEMFEMNVARIGEQQARRKYWMQAASSLLPLLLQWAKRISLFTVLIDYFRSKLGL